MKKYSDTSLYQQPLQIEPERYLSTWIDFLSQYSADDVIMDGKTVRQIANMIVLKVIQMGEPADREFEDLMNISGGIMTQEEAEAERWRAQTNMEETAEFWYTWNRFWNMLTTETRKAIGLHEIATTTGNTVYQEEVRKTLALEGIEL